MHKTFQLCRRCGIGSFCRERHNPLGGPSNASERHRYRNKPLLLRLSYGAAPTRRAAEFVFPPDRESRGISHLGTEEGSPFQPAPRRKVSLGKAITSFVSLAAPPMGLRQELRAIPLAFMPSWKQIVYSYARHPLPAYTGGHPRAPTGSGVSERVIIGPD